MAVVFYIFSLLIASNLILCIQDIRPQVSTIPSGNILKYANDELNLTCKFASNYSTSYRISWILPITEGGRVSHQESPNEVMISIHPLQEADSGPYTCAVSGHGVHVTKEIYVKVKSAKVSSCSLKMFPCSRGICIPQRFVCDGLNDCPGSKDESVDVCGVDPPCKGKIQCDDGRCVSAEKCCDPPAKPTNCRLLFKSPCCSQFSSLEDSEQHPGSGAAPSGSSPTAPHYSDINFIQSTIYTIVSCAIAFIFITLIMIVAICRIHMKRSAMSLHPPAGVSGLPHGASPGSLNTRRRLLFFLWPFCRLASHHHQRTQGQVLPHCNHRSRTPRWRSEEDDLASSDSLCGGGGGGANHPYPCTISSTGSFVVMYSSANGVRLIERLPKPPPYSETSGPSQSLLNPLPSSPETTWVPPNSVTSSAEIWGPPPAYCSVENVHRATRNNGHSESTRTTALL